MTDKAKEQAEKEPDSPKFKVGTKHYVQASDKFLTIMAFSQGYYMCRYKGCYPFLKSEKELINLLTARA